MPWSNALNTIDDVVWLVLAVLVALWKGGSAGRWIPCREEKPRNMSLVRDEMVMFVASTGRS